MLLYFSLLSIILVSDFILWFTVFNFKAIYILMILFWFSLDYSRNTQNDAVFSIFNVCVYIYVVWAPKMMVLLLCLFSDFILFYGHLE